VGSFESDNEPSGSIKKHEFLLPAERLLASQKGLFLVELRSCMEVLQEYFQAVSIYHSGIRICWLFGPCPSSGIVKNTTFRKLDLFPSSGVGWEIPAPFVHLERANF
jgi:hypothetical protein